MEAAAPEGYVRAFADEMPALLALLEDSRSKNPGFVDAVVAAYRAQSVLSRGEPRRVRPGHSAGEGSIVEQLSERELDVLRLVANGLSNNQIAEALFVSVGTVKKHLNNIFGKLNVANRTQATARARELDLIQ